MIGTAKFDILKYSYSQAIQIIKQTNINDWQKLGLTHYYMFTLAGGKNLKVQQFNPYYKLSEEFQAKVKKQPVRQNIMPALKAFKYDNDFKYKRQINKKDPQYKNRKKQGLI